MNQMTEAATLREPRYDRSLIGVGDVVCITGGPYQENLGKLLRVLWHGGERLMCSPLESDEDDERARLPGISENSVFVDELPTYRYAGPGEFVIVDLLHVRGVA